MTAEAPEHCRFGGVVVVAKREQATWVVIEGLVVGMPANKG